MYTGCSIERYLQGAYPPSSAIENALGNKKFSLQIVEQKFITPYESFWNGEAAKECPTTILLGLPDNLVYILNYVLIITLPNMVRFHLQLDACCEFTARKLLYMYVCMHVCMYICMYIRTYI